MNFEVLKTGFQAYLEEKGKIKTDDKSQNTNSSISIFMYASDFKDYLGEKFSGNKAEIQATPVDELLKMDFSDDGKLVNKSDSDDKKVDTETLEAFDLAISNGGEVESEETNTAETNTTESKIDENKTDKTKDTETKDTNNSNETDKSKDTSTPKNDKQGKEFVKDVFNELIQDDKFKKAIDKDGSGKIDETEMKDFVETIKNLDKNDKDVSVEDLLTAAEQIKNDVFNVAKDEKDLTEKDVENIKKDMQDTKAQNPQNVPSKTNTGGTSPTSSSGGVSGSPAGGGTYNPSVSAKSPQNMSESELKAELEKANKDLSDKQSHLSDIIDGSDSKIKGLQEAVDKSYKAYQEKLKEVDETMAKQVDEFQNKITDKEKEISNKDKSISDKETALSNAETSYNSAKSSRENLEGILSELQSSNNSNDKDLSSKISEVTSQLNSAKEAETKAKEAVETNKKELETLKKERQELETGEGGLNKLNEEMTKLKAEIAQKHPEVENAQKEWDKAKETLTTEKASASQNAKAEVATAQEKVNKLQKELTEFQNNEAKSKYNNKYNETAGKKIAQAGLNERGTVGYCLAGVADNLERVYGAGSFPGIPSAYMAADILASNEGIGAHFREVQVSRSDLPNLPAGAVVVWDNNANGGGSNVSAAGKVHGHISIALGDGRESSDHIQKQIVDRDANFRVFYPVS